MLCRAKIKVQNIIGRYTHKRKPAKKVQLEEIVTEVYYYCTVDLSSSNNNNNNNNTVY